MVLHDVAQRADWVVEVAAVLHTEVLGHRDLHGLDAVAIPQRFDDRIREPDVADVHRRLFAQEVVDAVDLPLLQVSTQLVVERLGRRKIMSERLFHHDPGVLGEAGAGEAVHDPAEQRGRDLQIEHRVAASTDGCGDLLIGPRIGEIAGHHGQPSCEPGEDVVVHRFAGGLDGGPGMLAQGVGGPVVESDADDRAIEQTAPLQAVQRPERHLPGQVPGDAEDHQNICGRSVHRHHFFSAWPPNSLRIAEQIWSVNSPSCRDWKRS